ncbi:MAG: 5-methylcytosine restriction system specificity protein McrC, partial [Streptosporangiaceae bacterium]
MCAARPPRRPPGATQVIPPKAPLPPWRPTRLNQRYQPALRPAELVLRNASAETGPGGIQVAAFVLSMWQVYEQFVGTALTESLRRYPGRTQTHPQFSSYLDEALPGHAHGAIAMALDVVHLVDGAPRLIFDARYIAEDPQARYPSATPTRIITKCLRTGSPALPVITCIRYRPGRSGHRPPQVSSAMAMKAPAVWNPLAR